MRNVEILRDYFLGKDPQQKETLADNSLRLIGIPGREFVLKVDFFKAVKDLRDAIEAEAKARADKDDELERLLNALNATVEGLADWANNSDFVYQDELDTALGGYYTKAQVDALVSTIPTFNIEIVQELPIEDISDSTIYLLAKQDGSGNDYYDEYIHVDGNWELIGSTSVDLTNYYTKDEADNKFVEDTDLYYIERALRVEGDITGNVIYGSYKETVDDYSQSQVVQDANFSYLVVDVLQGAEYKITGKGGGNEDNRLWALYDTSGNLVDKAPADTIYDEISLEPAQDGKLILNFTDDLTYPYEVIQYRFLTMEEVEQTFVRKTGDTMSGALINTASITVGSRAQNSTVGSHSAVIGTLNTASGVRSVAEGQGTVATGMNAHAEGTNTLAQQKNAHTEGSGTQASAENAHAEGNGAIASGTSSHAEGIGTTASGSNSHAEGQNTTASANTAHAEGGNAVASGAQSHAEGWNCIASYYSCHAEGTGTTANTQSAHSEGYGTVARGLAQHAGGYYNVVDTTATEGTAERGTYLRIVGNAANSSSRSNAYTLDWSGNGWFSGNVYVGSTSGTNKDAGSKKLATEDQIPSITYGTTDLTPGTSPLTEGTFYFVYE